MFTLLLLWMAAASSAHAFVGDASCAYGDLDCNRCVVDVEKTFRSIPDLPQKRSHLYYSRWKHLPPYDTYIRHIGLTSHIQGYSRLSGDEEWIVMSRSESGDAEGGSGFFLLNGKKRFFYPIPGMDHAGGLQTFGRTIAVGNECGSAKKCEQRPAWVDFFDASDPSRATHLNRLLMDGSRGEPEQLPADPNASYTAVTKLNDGRHLALIGGSESKMAWLYVSDRAGLSPSTQWNFVRFYKKLASWDGMYQNMNFVTECGTGKIFAIGMARTKLKRNLHLFTLEEPEGMKRVASKTLDWKVMRACNPRGGSGIHVTPQGGMQLYCASKIGAFFRPLVRTSVYTSRLPK